ncbi:MAG: hypothetical protein AB7I50_00860 [Vicinamibacterales bacterium]
MSNRQYPSPLSLEDLASRVRQEYVALPGLRLTESQVRRLWDMDQVASRDVLNHLVQHRFLMLTHAGQYVRADAARETEFSCTG